MYYFWNWGFGIWWVGVDLYIFILLSFIFCMLYFLFEIIFICYGEFIFMKNVWGGGGGGVG